MSAEPVIELDGISRVFGSGSTQTTALDSISLRVMPGEFVAIIGPSGSGKSTLLNVLGLLDRSTSGHYRLNGVDVESLSESERNRLRNETLGFVFQDSRMLLMDTAAGNASLGLKVRGTPWAARASRVATALQRLGLTHRMSERAINLSGGERQRVAIARAIATEPTVILADEPTGALDSKNSDSIIAHLRELNEQGVTVVVITHDTTVAAAADRRVEIVDGTIVSDSDLARANESENARREPAVERELGAVARKRFLIRLWDEFCDALSVHSSKPARALLLLTAFMLGAGGLVCSIGISESAAAQVTERLTRASLDEVVVRSASASAYDDGFYAHEGEATSAIAALEGVKSAGFVAKITAAEARITLLPSGAVPSQPVFGGPILIADAGYLDVLEATASPSHATDLLSARWAPRVALLGVDAAASLGVGTTGPGAQLWVDGEPVDVIGIIAKPGRNPELRDSIVLSQAAAASLTPDDASLVVRTVPGYPAALSEAIPLAVNPGDPSQVRIETVADLRNLRFGVATDLGTLVGIVSVLLLLLASMSSAIAMYLSVQARSPEIALRRALGSSRGSVWRLFTMEGLVIGAAGGVSGAALGVCAVVVVCMMQGWTPTLSPSVLLLGLFAGCVSGVCSATYPAIVAARADPAIAIRG